VRLSPSLIEQCEAAQTIKARYGLTAAFEYLVGEKLMNFANAASRHPDFARELSRFVSEVRRMFTPDEIGAHLEQIERAQSEQDVDVLDEDDPLRESPAAAAERHPAVHADQGITDRDHAWYFMTGQRKRFSMRRAACNHKRVHRRDRKDAPSQWRWNPFSPPMVC
jgi:hypothetical protein